MATPADLAHLLELLEDHPEEIDRLRALLRPGEEAPTSGLVEAQRRATEALSALAEAQVRTERAIEGLAEHLVAITEGLTALAQRVDALATHLQAVDQRLDQLAQRVDALATHLQAVDQRLDQLAQRVDHLTAVVERLVTHLGRLDSKVGTLTGMVLEQRFRDRGFAYFHGLARRVHVLAPDEIDEILDTALQDGILTEEEATEVRRTDVLARGKSRDDGSDLFLAVEVSYGIGPRDVERAARRARLLTKTGAPARPVVAGVWLTPIADELVERFGVAPILDEEMGEESGDPPAA